MYYIYSIYIFTSPTKVLVPLRHFWSHPQFDPKSSEGENPPLLRNLAENFSPWCAAVEFVPRSRLFKR